MWTHLHLPIAVDDGKGNARSHYSYTRISRVGDEDGVSVNGSESGAGGGGGGGGDDGVGDGIVSGVFGVGSNTGSGPPLPPNFAVGSANGEGERVGEGLGESASAAGMDSFGEPDIEVTCWGVASTCHPPLIKDVA